ncbi:MAG: TetR/AcrR family transcriptional regulator [Pseudobdellovibrionaceae bacterium]
MEKSKDPKELVLTASLVILNSYGYGALCLTEVAKRLKLSKQRVYYHYPGSEEIILTLAKRWSETGQLYTLKALADSNEQGCFRVKAMAEGMFDWIAVDPELARLGLVLYQLAPKIKKLGSFMNSAREAGRARIKSLLLSDQRFASQDLERLENAITAIHSHMYGSFFYFVAMNQSCDLVQTRQNCITGLDALLVFAAKEF